MVEQPRRTLSARASSVEAAHRIVTGAARLADLRPPEREYLAEGLAQAAEFLRKADPHTAEIARLLGLRTPDAR
jgi:hypothetical protein